MVDFDTNDIDPDCPVCRQILWAESEKDRRIAKLEELLRHCWLHSGYPDCGYLQMDTDKKRLYNSIVWHKES